MSDNGDIFKKACLLQYSTSIWQVSKAIDPALLNTEIQQNWVRGRKYIINPELLGPIRTAVHQGRNHIVKYALPFPVTGIYLVPKDRLDVIDNSLIHNKARFWAAVKNFVPLYEPAREEAREMLGEELFNENDYPEDITRCFKFDWLYLLMGVPSKSSVLSPEIFKREKDKFQELMTETRNMAQLALHKELLDIVNNLNERLNGANNGKPKVIKSSIFNHLRSFIDDLGARNIFDDEEIQSLSQQAKSIVEGVNPYSLSFNSDVRMELSERMNDIKTTILESIQDIPRRKIRMPQSMAEPLAEAA